MPYEVIDHTADTGIRVWAGTPTGLFAEACRAMFELITDNYRVTPVKTEKLSVEGIDQTDLLINWLRELLMLWSADRELVASAQISELSDTNLRATVWTQPFDPEKHVLYTDIKAVTYHGAEIICRHGHWETSVIFDV
ncbi:MAG: archease [Desulfobacterales bacterium]|nr:archease [Desulfobacterales bacterium]MBS3754771.1 archease [Desulfobacterales bacterium]